MTAPEPHRPSLDLAMRNTAEYYVPGTDFLILQDRFGDHFELHNRLGILMDGFLTPEEALGWLEDQIELGHIQKEGTSTP